MDVVAADAGEDGVEVLGLVLQHGRQRAGHGEDLGVAELAEVDDGAVGGVGTCDAVVTDL